MEKKVNFCEQQKLHLPTVPLCKGRKAEECFLLVKQRCHCAVLWLKKGPKEKQILVSDVSAYFMHRGAPSEDSMRVTTHNSQCTREVWITWFQIWSKKEEFHFLVSRYWSFSFKLCNSWKKYNLQLKLLHFSQLKFILIHVRCKCMPAEGIL